MREIKEKGAATANHYIRMTTLYFVIKATSGLLDEIPGLPRPGQCVLRAIHCETAPHIGDHPVSVVPAEHLWTFAGLIAYGFTLVCPVQQVG